MSGPHQGQTIYMSTVDIEVRLPHPSGGAVHCRYSRRDGDQLVEGLVQLHYCGDIASSPQA
ncbi:hypothetical protein [Actinacidiphila alni]|uniref:hypothetical protein n=1 Tax=Actinacidiphila alni TaxID=380248 RepID=UPI003451FD44